MLVVVAVERVVVMDGIIDGIGVAIPIRFCVIASYIIRVCGSNGCGIWQNGSILCVNYDWLML